MESPLQFFAGLEDPRVERTKVHLMGDIIFISIASVLCGADTWDEIEYFGKCKFEWLKTFLKLPEGIPSHDTFNRFFSALDPEKFEECSLQWAQSVAHLTEGEVVSIDGKAMRGSKGKGKKGMVHLVSAWASANELVLGQYKVDDKSNEITAIPHLLEVLVLKGCIVTIDAMGCQKDIASAIIGKGADYILALKGNQGRLLEQVEESFRFIDSTQVSVENDLGHGRIEKRTCSVIADLSMIGQRDQWDSLKTLIKIESQRCHKATQKTEKETRYYISSLYPNAAHINTCVRSHWRIENSLHWVLDVAFNEDHSRKRAGYAAQNHSVPNRIALNIIKNEKTARIGIKSKRLKAGWDNNYLLSLLKI
jgi:predicted transposase YbfD/YdcC